MRRAARFLSLVLVLALPASAEAAGELYTVAGTGTAAPTRDGQPATRAGLADTSSGTPLAPLADGGFLVGGETRVWRVDPQGLIHTVAGTGRAGTGGDGDGGPALRANVSVNELAALPGGGFLIVDTDHARVRLVDASGTITTVAGGGSRSADGVPAREARLLEPTAAAAQPGGGFVVGDGAGFLRRVGPDGRIRTIAGNGEAQDDAITLHGQPATSVPLEVGDVSVAPGGAVLVTDLFRGSVDRVAPDGTIGVAASLPGDRHFLPTSVAATPDGGLLVVDYRLGLGSRVWRAAPDGTLTALAGGGPFVATAPAGLEQRLTGLSATGANLQSPNDVVATPDGGALFSEAVGDALFSGDSGELVRYVAPATPAVLAVALLRDRDRVFAPGGANAISLALTLPATVTLTAGGRTTTSALGAGVSRLALPGPLAGGRPRRVTVLAADAAGRRAYDSVRIYPPRWLPDETARLVAAGLRSAVLPSVRIEGDGVARCRRFGPVRVDCVVAEGTDHCGVASITLAHGRLRWATYACEIRSHPRYRRSPRPLARRDWTCDKGDITCPPRLFGTLSEAALVPSS